MREQSTTHMWAQTKNTMNIAELRNKPFGNPFLDQTKELVTIDSQNVMPQNVVDSLEQIHILGETKYRTFIGESLLKNETRISGTIPRNSLAVFRKPKRANPSKDRQKSLCIVFPSLRCQPDQTEGDSQEFFKHENQKYPPTLSSSGKLERFSCQEYAACRSNSHEWCSCCAYSSNWGIENLRRICKGCIHPACVFGTGKNSTRGYRLGCIHEGQYTTFNNGKQGDRNKQASVWPCQASRDLEKLLTK